VDHQKGFFNLSSKQNELLEKEVWGYFPIAMVRWREMRASIVDEVAAPLLFSCLVMLASKALSKFKSILLIIYAKLEDQLDCPCYVIHPNFLALKKMIDTEKKRPH
jgi:hypothetical protein